MKTPEEIERLLNALLEESELRAHELRKAHQRINDLAQAMNDTLNGCDQLADTIDRQALALLGLQDNQVVLAQRCGIHVSQTPIREPLPYGGVE